MIGYVFLISWPAAGIDNRSSRSIEQFTKIGIACIHLLNIDVTAVQFHLIYAPFRKSLGINFLVVENAWITAAREISIVLEVYKKNYFYDFLFKSINYMNFK